MTTENNAPAVENKEKWIGIYKVIEESGELLQILGKLGPFPDGNHPGKDVDLKSDLEDELADLYAALAYFCEKNNLDTRYINIRVLEKLEKFKSWGLSGIKVDQP